MMLRSRFGITGEVDATDWAGATILTVDAQTVTAAATTSFSSPIAALNGRGMLSGRSLGQELTTYGTGAGSWTTGITPTTGCMFMRYTGGGGLGSFQLTVVGAEAEAFGFGPAGTVIIATDRGGGVFQADAPYLPLPGTITNAHLTLDPADGATFTVPANAYRAQSVITLLRSVSGGGSPDLDQLNPADSFAYRLGQLDTEEDGARWGAGLTDDGYTWISAPGDFGGTTITWAATTAGRAVKKAFGFRGDELPVSVVGDVGTVKIWTGTHLNLDAVVTNRPMRTGFELSQEEESTVHRMMDGELVAAITAVRREYRLGFWLQGLDEPGPDLHEHFLAFLDRHPRGGYIEAHPRWGDFRRAQPTSAAVYHAGAWTRPPFSTLWTSARNGLVGRRCLQHGMGDQTKHTVRLEHTARRIEAEIIAETAPAGLFEAS